MQGPLRIIRETWEDKAKPLEGVASYILQMRLSGRNLRISPEKSKEAQEELFKKQERTLQVLHKLKSTTKLLLLLSQKINLC